MKSMNQARQRYLAMTAREQALFLSQLAAELTVWARDTYRAGTEEVDDPTRLRTFNEMLHRVTFHQRDLLRGTKERYPDDVLFDILRAFAAELRVENQFTALVVRAPAPPRKAPRNRRGTRQVRPPTALAPVVTS